MLDERALPRPGFTEGPRIVLGDGQAWAFPRPLAAALPGARRRRPAHGRGRPGLRAPTSPTSSTSSSIATPTTRRPGWPSSSRWPASLLAATTTLTDRDLRRLLAIDLADPALRAAWAQINQVLLGRPPKPSADGSATP